MNVVEKTSYLWDGFELSFEPVEDALKVRKTKRGFEVRYLTMDSYPESPRTMYDNPTLMVFMHKRYDIGDKHDYKSESFESWSELEAQLIKDHKPLKIKPVRLYDHSGLSFSTSRSGPFSCRFDSGQVGFILVPKDNVCGTTVKHAAKVIEEDLKDYNSYMSGECYMTVTELFDKKKNEIECECFGGYFSKESALSDLTINA